MVKPCVCSSRVGWNECKPTLLQIGDLVWGVVNAIVSYGAFVTMDEYPSVRALLHIANISQEHVRTVEVSPKNYLSQLTKVMCKE